MKLTIKQQLIALSLAGATYRDLWYYLRQIITLGLLKPSLEPAEYRQVLTEAQVISNGQLNLDLSFDHVSAQAEFIQQLTQQSLVIGEANYPTLWLEIPKPPLLIYYRGNLGLLSEPLIGIVGTRSITDDGIRDATYLTNELNYAGWCCVSGMAKGVDACVHQTALRHPFGKTIAIVPTGLNHCYPSEHTELYQRLMMQQLVLSEYLPDVTARKHHFIMRNRLVAGIAPAIVVVEAAQKSGSLITANYALQYNREVYACPGHLTNHMAAGCNQLITAGATGIYDVKAFLDELRCLYQAQQLFN